MRSSSSSAMTGTHSTGLFFHSLTHFFTDGVAVFFFCCLILVTTGSFFLHGTHYNRAVLLDTCYTRVVLVVSSLTLATRIDPIDTDCFVTPYRSYCSIHRFHWHAAADPFFKPFGTKTIASSFHDDSCRLLLIDRNLRTSLIDRPLTCRPS